MQPEYLGRFKTMIDLQSRDVGAYVVWLDDADRPIAAQLPTSIECPECHVTVGLERFKNQAALGTPAVNSFSVTCASCGGAIHFDKTPAESRARLTWTSQYRR